MAEVTFAMTSGGMLVRLWAVLAWSITCFISSSFVVALVWKPQVGIGHFNENPIHITSWRDPALSDRSLITVFNSTYDASSPEA